MNDWRAHFSTDVLVNFQFARVLLVLVGLVALVGLVYLAQSAQTTMTGKRVVRLQERLEMLRRENAQLEYEIAVLNAPNRIAERATRLGMRPVTAAQIKYIVVGDYPMPSSTASARTTMLTASPSAATRELAWAEWLARLGWREAGSSAAARLKE